MKHLLVITVAGALCAGCATNGSTWKQVGRSTAQMESDLKVCEYEANLAIGSGQQTPYYGRDIGGAIGTGLGDGIANGIRIVQLRTLCMEARGYRQQ